MTEPQNNRPAPRTDAARMRAILALTAAVVFAVAPFATEPFTGYADWPRLPIQPAGYAFAIWGLIYLGLVASTGYGLLARADDAGWDATRWPLIASLAVGAGWLSAATVAPILSVAMILVMLATAILALRRAPAGDLLWLGLPLGLYAGWLTAAAAVALGTALVGAAGWPAGPVSWAMLGLVTALGLWTLSGLSAAPWGYAGALAWALIGSLAALLTGSGQMPLVIGTLVALGLISATVTLNQRRQRPQA